MLIYLFTFPRYIVHHISMLHCVLRFIGQILFNVKENSECIQKMTNIMQAFGCWNYSLSKHPHIFPLIISYLSRFSQAFLLKKCLHSVTLPVFLFYCLYLLSLTYHRSFLMVSCILGSLIFLCQNYGFPTGCF